MNAVRFYDATIGKKVVMAVTGVILALYLVAHMVGNLQIFAGASKINQYADFLHKSAGLLWTARVVLLATIVLHVKAALELYSLKAAARPIAYAKKTDRGATFASRFMIWSGYALAAFIVYHILHFTTGHAAHVPFREGDVFHNVTMAFKEPAIAGMYVAAMAFVSVHLYHGLFSLFQSVGVSHPSWLGRIKPAARFLAVLLAAGFAVIPIAIFASLVR